MSQAAHQCPKLLCVPGSPLLYSKQVVHSGDLLYSCLEPKTVTDLTIYRQLWWMVVIFHNNRIDLMVYNQVCNSCICNRLDWIPSSLSIPCKFLYLWIDLTVYGQVCNNWSVTDLTEYHQVCPHLADFPTCGQTWQYSVKSVILEVSQTWLYTVNSAHTSPDLQLVDRLDGIQSSL